MKNIAMMGLCVDTDGGGELVVTDMDGIEVSNLSRQFLFRARHVGMMKSTVAAESATAMNASLCVKALTEKVCPATEDVFSSSFWQRQNIVISALDNVTARKYVDSKCVMHRKPLMESGTPGTKCNTLPIIPNLTESYASDPVQEDQQDKDAQIPACTLTRIQRSSSTLLLGLAMSFSKSYSI